MVVCILTAGLSWSLFFAAGLGGGRPRIMSAYLSLIHLTSTDTSRRLLTYPRSGKSRFGSSSLAIYALRAVFEEWNAVWIFKQHTYASSLRQHLWFFVPFAWSSSEIHAVKVELFWYSRYAKVFLHSQKIDSWLFLFFYVFILGRNINMWQQTHWALAERIRTVTLTDRTQLSFFVSLYPNIIPHQTELPVDRVVKIYSINWSHGKQ